MKKSAEVVELPVMSITEGKELGLVKELLIDAAAGKVAALVIDDGKWYFGAKLIPYSAIIGIGESLITVDNSNLIVPVNDSPEFQKLLTANVKVIGAKVITKSGNLQGTVQEITIDDTGKITECEIKEPAGEIYSIPAHRIITFSPEIVFVTDDEQNSQEKSTATTEAAATSPGPVPSPAAEPAGIEFKPFSPAETIETTPAEPGAGESASPEDFGKIFDEKQRKFLLGKKASRKIETDNGVLIVEQGEEITEEVLQKAKLVGKFVELTMSVQ